ncbi:hypothetical protein T265_04906 [Opisthorchis viverrini]|uniref:Uncharacterized protein n=1 Tax=Opisthorchis viverrini TaxID=6198 RepID=A0A074ZMD8_OPIVI|nr:hypothetical protein T265_04906 [Opisthorchis viverrini]KER28231.1 hypothetical protein T265_04906 [Opisthorchis viverrini]
MTYVWSEVWVEVGRSEGKKIEPATFITVVFCEVRDSNRTSASRFPLLRLGYPGSISAFVLPSGGMAVRRRKDATAECTRYTTNKSGSKRKIKNRSAVHSSGA